MNTDTQTTTLARDLRDRVAALRSSGVHDTGGILLQCAETLEASQAEIARLREALEEAWSIGADHRAPTFEQINRWREALAQTSR